MAGMRSRRRRFPARAGYSDERSDPSRIFQPRGPRLRMARGLHAKKKAAGAAFLSRGWSSRGPRLRARCTGGEYPRGTHRKHRSKEHRALTWFQSCFVRRGNGFIGRLSSGVWCGSNTLGWSKAVGVAARGRLHCDHDGRFSLLTLPGNGISQRRDRWLKIGLWAGKSLRGDQTANVQARQLRAFG